MTPRSFVTLAFYFVWRLMARLFGRRRGLATFQTNYAADRLLPLTVDERRCFEAASRCIACGLCDAELERQAHHDRTVRAPVRPSDIPLAYTRSLPDHDALLPLLPALDTWDLERLTRVCPTRVPFVALVKVIGARQRGRAAHTEPAQEE